MLLRLLQEGGTLTSVARRLGLTQPAVSQRVRKLGEVFQFPILEKEGRRVRLTSRGRSLCAQAEAALAIMGDLAPQEEHPEVRVGARPEVGRSWLWPAVERLRKRRPELTFHLSFGTGDEVIRRLGTGDLDALVTSAPQPLVEFQARELAEELYLFAASPELAGEITAWTDLERQVLVEHDPSFPFLRYLSPEDRARLRFQRVWFAGSSELMVRALVKGFGVGIVPEYLARKHLTKGELVVLFPDLPLASDRFRLVSRRARILDPALDALAEELVRLGLR